MKDFRLWLAAALIVLGAGAMAWFGKSQPREVTIITVPAEQLTAK